MQNMSAINIDGLWRVEREYIDFTSLKPFLYIAYEYFPTVVIHPGSNQWHCSIFGYVGDCDWGEGLEKGNKK